MMSMLLRCKLRLLSGLANVILYSKLVSAYMLLEAEERAARNQRLLIIKLLNTSGLQQRLTTATFSVGDEHRGSSGTPFNKPLMPFADVKKIIIRAL